MRVLRPCDGVGEGNRIPKVDRQYCSSHFLEYMPVRLSASPTIMMSPALTKGLARHPLLSRYPRAKEK